MSVSYVYFIDDDMGHTKIGKAVNPESRLRELSTGNASKLEIWQEIMCPSDKRAMQLEAALHKQFSEYRLNGEWFRRRPIEKWFNEEVFVNGLYSSVTEGNFIDCNLLVQFERVPNKPINKCNCVFPKNVDNGDCLRDGYWQDTEGICECGQPVYVENAYCPKCGKRLDWSEAWNEFVSNCLYPENGEIVEIADYEWEIARNGGYANEEI